MGTDVDKRWRASRPFRPAFRATHPGEALQEEILRPLELDPRAIAPRIGLRTEELLDLLDGRARVTRDLAERLNLEFGTPAEWWLELQARWDEWDRRDKSM